MVFGKIVAVLYISQDREMFSQIIFIINMIIFLFVFKNKHGVASLFVLSHHGPRVTLFDHNVL